MKTFIKIAVFIVLVIFCILLYNSFQFKNKEAALTEEKDELMQANNLMSSQIALINDYCTAINNSNNQILSANLKFEDRTGRIMSLFEVVNEKAFILRITDVSCETCLDYYYN